MKNAFGLPVLLLLVSLAFGCGKGKDCNNSINAVQPNTNPPGYEVLLKTTGFSPAAKVVFGTVEAVSRAGGESDDLIARVPAGLSGNVEVSVEEGDCIARSAGFVVSGTLPTGVQPSLPDILVPVTSSSLPQGFSNFWRNAADDQTGISIQGSLTGQIFTLDNTAKEFDFIHPNSNDNPVKGNINTSTKVIYLEVDRTAKGGIIEHFDGQFINKPASLSLPAGADPVVIFLVSRESGRQLILYYQ